MENYEIPSWWAAINLVDASSKLVDGSHNPPAKQSVGYPMLSAVNIYENKILFSDYRLVSEEAFALEDRRTQIEPGDVLLTIVGAIGRTAVVPEKIPKFTLQRSVAVITPRHISSKFLMYQFESPRITRYFQKNARGTAQKGVYLKTLGNTEIWLPPLKEQHRIVAKIEALFSELDKGIESFKTAREQLKIYRQALLKHAFSGKLTEQWRTENADKLESAEALLQRIQTERQQRYQQQLKDWEANGKPGSKPKAPKTLPPLMAEELAELPDLPVGWVWVNYGELCTVVKNGISEKPIGEDGTPIFRISAVRPLFFDMSDIRYIDNSTGRFDHYYLERGDLVFTRYNGSRHYVGVCAEYRSDQKCLFPDKLVQTRIFSQQSLSSSYLEKALNCGASRKYIESKIRTTAGQSGVSGDDIKSTPVPICSIDEQIQIVNLVESKLTAIDQLDQTITTALQQAEALRQAILKKAFSGQLVPQDPEDEPASVLLERIRAENAQANIQPTRRRGKRHE